MMIICAKLVLKLSMHNKVMGRTRTGTTEAYAQSLSVDCDLDLRPSDMGLVRDNRLVMMIICAKLFFDSHHA